MSSAAGTNQSAIKSGRRWNLSLDSWAVVLAFLTALLIRAGILKHIPW